MNVLSGHLLHPNNGSDSASRTESKESAPRRPEEDAARSPLWLEKARLRLLQRRAGNRRWSATLVLVTVVGLAESTIYCAAARGHWAEVMPRPLRVRRRHY
jgi:hypothetical protein